MERAYRAVFLIGLLLGILLLIPLDRVTADGRLIEIIADSDNQFKVPGQKKAVITLKAGEPVRSEERRVGKECRSRWSPDPEKKKKRERERGGKQKGE